MKHHSQPISSHKPISCFLQRNNLFLQKCKTVSSLLQPLQCSIKLDAQPLRLETFSLSSKLNCSHSLQGNILKMVDNIAKSIKRKPFASTSVFSALWGSGVPIF
jgi:hypothetical protein